MKNVTKDKEYNLFFLEFFILFQKILLFEKIKKRWKSKISS